MTVPRAEAGASVGWISRRWLPPLVSVHRRERPDTPMRVLAGLVPLAGDDHTSPSPTAQRDGEFVAAQQRTVLPATWYLRCPTDPSTMQRVIPAPLRTQVRDAVQRRLGARDRGGRAHDPRRRGTSRRRGRATGQSGARRLRDEPGDEARAPVPTGAARARHVAGGQAGPGRLGVGGDVAGRGGRGRPARLSQRPRASRSARGHGRRRPCRA